MVWAVPARAAGRVQFCTGSNNSAAATSVSCTWPAPTTAGNLLVAVLVEAGGSGFQNPTTDAGWSLGNPQKDNGNLHIRMYVNVNSASHGGTATWTFSAVNASIYMVEYAGALTSNPADGNSATQGSTSPGSTGTASLGQSDEIAVGAMGVLNSGDTFSGETFTQVAQKSSTDATYGLNAAFEEQIISGGSGSVGTSATISGSATWVGILQTFKVATKNWVGGQPGSFFSNQNNWSGGVLPGAGDIVILSSSNNAAMVIDQDTTLAGFSVRAGYTANITQSGTHNMIVSGDLELFAASGTFTAPAGRLQIGGKFNKTGTMTFAHNGGTVLLRPTASLTDTFGGAVFNTLMVNDGLVGYWKLDEATAGSTVVDASGNKNDGIPTGSPVPYSTSVPRLEFADPEGLGFVGASSQSVALGTTNLPANNAAQTISLWVYYTATAATKDFISLTNGTSTIQIGFNSAGQVAMWNSGGSAASLVNVTAPSTSVWHHVAYTYDGTTHRLYIDGGTPVSSVAAANTAVPNAGTLGNRSGASESFTGNLDDVRIYTRALGPTEISALSAGNGPGTSATTSTFADALTTAGDFLIGAGTVSPGSNAITVGGSWLNYGGLFTTGTGTVTFNGASATNTIIDGQQWFHAVTINNPAGTGVWTLKAPLYVSGAIALTNGTLNLSSYRVHAWNVTNTGGTLTPSTSTLTLDGPADLTFTPAAAVTNLRLEDPTEANLVGYWKLDDGLGNRAMDSSATGNNGTLGATLGGGVRWSSNAGLPSSITFDDPYCVTLDGSHDFLSMGTTAIPANNASQSISLWVYYTANSASALRDFIAIDNGASSGLYLGLNASNQLAAWKWGGTSLVAATAPTINAWHNVVYTWNGTTNSLSVDGGTPTTSITAVNTGAATEVQVGRKPSGSEYFGGRIDDLRIYNVALTSTQVRSLGGGTYAGTGGTKVVTLGANTTVNAALNIDSAVLDTATFTLATAAVSTTTVAFVNAGTYKVGSGTQTINGGLTVRNAGTLSLATSGGTVRIGSARTLTVDGTLSASSAGAAIASISGNYAFTVGSSAAATPTLNISALSVSNTDTNGMNVNANAAAVTAFTQFDNIAFGAGTGNDLLQVTARTLYLSASGCTFDAGVAATTLTTVRLTGNGTGDGTDTRIVFGQALCSSSFASCQASKSDDDPDNNGIGNTPATNGAVIQFVTRVADDTAGTVQGFPTAAIDWNTFTYYSTYVAFHDASGTSDVVYVRDEAGAAKYAWSAPAGENLIGTPLWITVGSTHYLYVATTVGHVYRLIDNTVGQTLSPDGSGNWAGTNNPFNCSCTISTPLVIDANNVYWGGTASGQKLWTLGQLSRAQPVGSPFSITPTITSASPTLWTSGATSYLFLGLIGHLLKINISNQTLDADNSSPGTASIFGRVVTSSNRVFAGDDAGTMWAIDPNSFGNTNKVWSYHDPASNAIKGSPYYDAGTGSVQYGTQGGTIIVLNAAGTPFTGYPYLPASATDTINTALIEVNGVLVAGTTTGKLYIVDRNNGTTGPALIREYAFGPTEAVSGVSFDSDVGRYMVSTADPSTLDGRLYYIDAVADPTPGAS